MAITASLYVNQSSVVPGTRVACALVVSNSAAGDVSVTAIRPHITPTASSALVGSVAPQTAAIPNTGSVGFGFTFVAGAPQRSGDTQGAYAVSATVECSDGSVVTPEAVTVQVSSLLDPVPETDLGHLRFDSNLNSELIALL